MKNTFFLSKQDLEIIAPYVDSESLKHPVITPKTPKRKPLCIWESPSKEDVATIINFIDEDAMDLASICGLSAKTLVMLKTGKSHFNLSYSDYVILCRLAACKQTKKRMPKAGGNIFTPSDKKILSEFFKEETMIYPKNTGEKSGKHGEIIWEQRPTIDQVAKLLTAIYSEGYKVKNVMKELGLADRTVRAKKTTHPCDLSQFILLCEMYLKINKGKGLTS